ncbi:MAG: hypothetical protein WCI17_11670 [bacterium]
MKPLYSIVLLAAMSLAAPLPLRAGLLGFLTGSESSAAAAAPGSAAGGSGGSAVDKLNEHLNSNEGGTVISVTKDGVGAGLEGAAMGHHQAAWQGSKGGASSQTIGNHLEVRDGLKNAGKILDVGGKLIDHAGWSSTAAGEVAGGQYGQAVITTIDGLGKWGAQLVGGVLGGAAGGAAGTAVGGPAGTAAGAYVGSTGGSYAAGAIWDATLGKLTGAIKEKITDKQTMNQITSQWGPKIPAGSTPESIHAAWLEWKAKYDADQKAAAEKAAAEKAAAAKAAEKAAIAKAAAEKAAAEKAAADKAAEEKCASEKAAADRKAAAKAAADKAAAAKAAADKAAAAAKKLANTDPPPNTPDAPGSTYDDPKSAGDVHTGSGGTISDKYGTTQVDYVTDKSGKTIMITSQYDKDGKLVKRDREVIADAPDTGDAKAKAAAAAAQDAAKSAVRQSRPVIPSCGCGLGR